jgi:transcription termination/antitermination protein NusA
MQNELKTAFDEIADLRSLPRETIVDALQSALVSAYRRDTGASNGQHITAEIDPDSGRARIFVEKEVCEDILNPDTEVLLEEARFFDPEAQIGDVVMVQVKHTTKQFGRIAAQTAKQVILQKIREAEREALYNEFVGLEGDLLTGTVQNVQPGRVTLVLNGRAEAILPRPQQIPGERFRHGDKVRVFVLEVQRSNRAPLITVSRSHRSMLRRLLEYEVPEIYNGQVEIKSIAREAGHRSKIAVAALQDGVDPVGACVGMRGIRIQNIVNELHGEKIDVIEWNPDAEQFIAKALSPARVTGVYLDEGLDGSHTAVVVVPDDQLSLAIGREGQNARLAAKLTGWRIDIKSVAETVQDGLTLMETPDFEDFRANEALVTDVQRILAKRENEMTIMPEEYTALANFAGSIEGYLQQKREVVREEKRAAIAAVRETISPEFFEIPVEAMQLEDEVLEVLSPLESIGEVMLLFLVDEDRLVRLLATTEGEPLMALRAELDRILLEGIDWQPEDAEPEAVDAAEAEGIAEAAAAAPEVVTADAAADVPEGEAEPVVKPDEIPVDIFSEAKAATALEELGRAPKERRFEPGEPQDEDVDLLDADKNKKKQGKQKKRQLVFDESSGRTVAKRRRKGARSDTWEIDDF